ncbi:methylmalonyl Co-A mutase-associated GTPase MeaB [Nakamurella leprariae]|uniref:Methylmalonyl Co-A mutase-associated GTPase MeaB n=1 Tax=Nakamurella leprariae TaxID=2803911 RepID=A0A939C0C2_9ACTN|nr:methylmalonyl Co-A mutase-associated GTPase MeaB [Nakamurella leprariae]MBM9469075.1 methylmalonyl Co-A mutase-associated GTPase MeaB [Nakamurella leprariae]
MRIDLDELDEGLLGGRRAAIGRALTLVESSRPDHQQLAADLLGRVRPRTGQAVRVGISGVPGVGKSTFIDALGMHLIGAGHKVAVLAIDPSSARTGGSVLGDKTRMSRLAAADEAFVRPSPTSGTLGGVARATREAMLVMEAAGFDVVLVETVGVGQSEYAVASMVDSFLFLTLARTGDQLQGIKRGILELADVIAVNKADGPHVQDAKLAARELAGAIRLLRGPGAHTKVLTCSALHDGNIDEVWAALLRHRDGLARRGELEPKRRSQQVDWSRALVRDRLLARLALPSVRPAVKDAEAAVLAGELTAEAAVEQILAAVHATEERTQPAPTV